MGKIRQYETGILNWGGVLREISRDSYPFTYTTTSGMVKYNLLGNLLHLFINKLCLSNMQYKNKHKYILRRSVDFFLSDRTVQVNKGKV